MTYTVCKRLIERGTFVNQEQKDDLQDKMDIFLLNNRLSQVNYNELTQMLVEKDVA